VGFAFSATSPAPVKSKNRAGNRYLPTHPYCRLSRRDQSFAAAGACAGSAAGAIDVGAAGRCFGAGCFLADAMTEVGGEAGLAAGAAAAGGLAAAD